MFLSSIKKGTFISSNCTVEILNMKNFRLTISYLFIFCSTTVLYNCSSQNNSSIDAKEEIEIQFDSVRYEFAFDKLDTNYIFGSSKICVAFNYNDTSFFATDNFYSGKIYCYSLTNPMTCNIINYPSGFNFIEDKLLAFVSPKEFYLLSEKGVFYHYFYGKYLDSITINQHKQLSENGLWVSPFMFAQQKELSIHDDTLYISILPDLSNTAYSKDAFEGKTYPVTAKYNLIEETISIASFFYPEELLKNNFGQYNLIMQYHKNSDTSIYYAGCLPYIYLSVNGKLKKINCKSLHQVDSIRPVDFENSPNTRDKMILHAQESGNYQWFIYDEFNDCYYRSYTLPLAEKNAEGFYNTYLDQRIAIMKLNNKFKVVAEYLLPQQVNYLFVAAPTPSGLIINKREILKNVNHGFEFYRLNFISKN